MLINQSIANAIITTACMYDFTDLLFLQFSSDCTLTILYCIFFQDADVLANHGYEMLQYSEEVIQALAYCV